MGGDGDGDPGDRDPGDRDPGDRDRDDGDGCLLGTLNCDCNADMCEDGLVCNDDFICVVGGSGDGDGNPDGDGDWGDGDPL
jgi:hypothetical protein